MAGGLDHSKRGMPLECPERGLNEYIDYGSTPQISEFGKLLGIEILEYDRAKHSVQVEWKLSQAHSSRAGKAHGGAIAAVFDAVCGLATFTTLDRGDVCSTI